MTSYNKHSTNTKDNIEHDIPHKKYSNANTDNSQIRPHRSPERNIMKNKESIFLEEGREENLSGYTGKV